MALHQALAQLGLHEFHRMPLEAHPLIVGLGILQRPQAHVIRVRITHLGPRRHGHHHQPFHLFRIIQCVLQGNGCPQRVSHQHQVLVHSLCPQPAAHPLHIPGDVGTTRPFQMPRQIGRNAVREMLALKIKRVGTSAGAGSVKENKLRHAKAPVNGRGVGAEAIWNPWNRLSLRMNIGNG